MVDKDTITPEVRAAVAEIMPSIHRCRRALHEDHRTPAAVQVSPEMYRRLDPVGPVFVYAAPFPQIMGLPIHPNPDLRGSQVAVTERW